MKNLTLSLLVVLLCHTSANPILDQKYLPKLLHPSNGNQFITEIEDETKTNVKVDIDDVQYYLYTRQNPYTPQQITNGNLNLLNGSNFDPEKDILIGVHGWIATKDNEAMTTIREAAIEAHDINVIIVDWSGLANTLYSIAKNSVVGVGEIIGDFLTELELVYNLNPSKILLVGHSFGAHIIGVAGARIQQNNQTVEYIVGLDPTAPLYDLTAIGNRLDSTDANFVQVIHTGCSFYGIESPIGHSDYYPNGGFQQPGCGLDLIGACAHNRAPLFYAESIRRGGGFSGKKCVDYNTYNTGVCVNNLESSMGLFYIDTAARGVYYLKTNANSPYGQG